ERLHRAARSDRRHRAPLGRPRRRRGPRLPRPDARRLPRLDGRRRPHALVLRRRRVRRPPLLAAAALHGARHARAHPLALARARPGLSEWDVCQAAEEWASPAWDADFPRDPPWSHRIANWLRRMRYTTTDQLVWTSDAELLTVPGVGPKTVGLLRRLVPLDGP